MSTQEEKYVTPIEPVLKKSLRPMESEELNKLFEALAKAQLDMDVAKTDSTNPFFKSKYADLRSVVEASRPFLSKNGLCVIQRTIPGNNGISYLYTRLGHLSGQWVESVMPINPPKQDIQTLGSYLTYLRRYSYSSMVGVVAGDEDDDGENAMKEARTKKVVTTYVDLSPIKDVIAQEKISKAQLGILAEELKEEEKLLENIFKGMEISKLSDMPLRKYEGCIKKIRKIKYNREEAS